jgi:hypothetical protein
MTEQISSTIGDFPGSESKIHWLRHLDGGHYKRAKAKMIEGVVSSGLRECLSTHRYLRSMLPSDISVDTLYPRKVIFSLFILLPHNCTGMNATTT